MAAERVGGTRGDGCDSRVVNFAGAIGVSGGTVDQEVAAFKIRGVLRRASGR